MAYLLGAGLVAVLFADAGILQFIAGIVVGAIFAVGAFVLAFPVVLVIVVSAASGAVAVVNGVLIALGTIKVAAWTTASSAACSGTAGSPSSQRS